MIFMQDSAPLHVSRYSFGWLASRDINVDPVVTWLLCSPVVNLIKNLWALFKQQETLQHVRTTTCQCFSLICCLNRVKKKSSNATLKNSSSDF